MGQILSKVYWKIVSFLFNVPAFDLRELINWSKKDFSMPAPHKVKMQTLKRWGGEEVWIESGTHSGDTAISLASFANQVITFEPSVKYFNLAYKRLKSFNNIEILEGSSEILLENILEKLSRAGLVNDISFWLDGHYSGGETYRGKEDTPILIELETIKKYLPLLKTITICIDDVRLFRTDIVTAEKYPDLYELINWARLNGLYSITENDIFIITNRK
jgi:hypothetical protein